MDVSSIKKKGWEILLIQYNEHRHKFEPKINGEQPQYSMVIAPITFVKVIIFVFYVLFMNVNFFRCGELNYTLTMLTTKQHNEHIKPLDQKERMRSYDWNEIWFQWKERKRNGTIHFISSSVCNASFFPLIFL